MRDNLVIVSAGPESQHPNWIATGLTCDLAVVNWGGAKWEGKYTMEQPPKTPLLKSMAIMAQQFHHEWAAKYDGFWLLCDDMQCSGTDMNHFLMIADQLGCDWCQPSITDDSLTPYSAQYHLGNGEFRPTCFCEIGFSYMSARVFWIAVPMYLNLQIGYGYGTEAALRKVLRVKHGRTRFCGTVGIIDKVVFRHIHRRRQESPLYVFGNPQDEFEDTLKRYDVRHTVDMYEP